MKKMIVLLLLLLLIAGVGCGPSEADLRAKAAEEEAAEKRRTEELSARIEREEVARNARPGVTRRNYLDMVKGKHYDEVVKVLGEPTDNFTGKAVLFNGAVSDFLWQNRTSWAQKFTEVPSISLQFDKDKRLVYRNGWGGELDGAPGFFATEP